MSPNRARVSVSARPSITPRIRRQTCNARSCRPLPVAPRSRCSRSRSSRGSSRPTPHVQTEDNEKTLTEYILGRGYLGCFFFKTHPFRAIMRVARSCETIRLNRRCVSNIRIMLLLLDTEKKDLTRNEYFIFADNRASDY